MAGDDFLSRWSRRKREVVQAEVPGEPGEFATQPEADALPIATDDVLREGEPLADAAVAALPSLDSFTVETDLAQFLRAGVPQALRNAALRRMWSIDPSIRDYLSEAREYAFDWHIPGAVPGTGPMLPTDDIAGMVRDIFAGSKPQTVEPASDETTFEDAQDDAASTLQADAIEEFHAPELETPEVRAPVIAVATPSVEAEGERKAEATTVETSREAVPGGRLRRHGGALPI